MGYSTASTEWPEQTLSEPIRKIIDELFATLDDSTDAGADRLAEDNFTPNGEFLAHHAAHGKEGSQMCSSSGDDHDNKSILF